MRYLITGGAGFIGSHLVDALTMRGDSVLVLDDLSTGKRENLEHVLDSELVDFIEGSVLDEAAVDDCMRSVDCCLHLASAVGVQLVVSRPLETLQRNVSGNNVVISAAARYQCPLLFTSTSEAIRSSAHEAERTLTTLSSGVTTVLKQNASEVERTLLGVGADIGALLLSLIDLLLDFLELSRSAPGRRRSPRRCRRCRNRRIRPRTRRSRARRRSCALDGRWRECWSSSSWPGPYSTSDEGDRRPGHRDPGRGRRRHPR